MLICAPLPSPSLSRAGNVGETICKISLPCSALHPNPPSIKEFIKRPADMLVFVFERAHHRTSQPVADVFSQFLRHCYSDPLMLCPPVFKITVPKRGYTHPLTPLYDNSSINTLLKLKPTCMRNHQTNRKPLAQAEWESFSKGAGGASSSQPASKKKKKKNRI